ncbi:hypothetical protein [Flavobacterium sp. '19STA2R22 D10 B1']|uniref:hypothetical protein n=1 Tax=Flavobacterium aerium TaxID=3037261 RepID=UPI00278C70FA|nr:hypothetical protein [Flavobacterium sp. '19STA2R22 D10 B1']
MENQNLDSQKSNSSLKAIIIILAILLVGSLAYMYKMSNDSATKENTLMTEKETVLKDLETLKATYDTAIAENTSLSSELVAERDKVTKLMEDLKKSKGDAASMAKYKDQYVKLERDMKGLIKENDILKQQNAALTTQRDSTQAVLTDTKRYNDTLVVQNENLSKTVEKASALSILNLKTEAIKERSSGKQIVTEKARRADKLKVCFTIAENKIAKSGDKTYYVQIIDSKNNVLGEKKIINFGSQNLTYSFTTVVKYDNKTTDVCEYLTGTEAFEKGNYFVNVFDGKEMVSKTSFSLR